MGQATRLPWLSEIDIPDKVRAAASSKAALSGFPANFGEWRDRVFRGDNVKSVRLQTIDNVIALDRSAVPITIPVTYDPSTSDMVQPDFSNLLSKGRRGSRQELVEALSTAFRRIVAPNDHVQAVELASSWDGGILRGGGCAFNPLSWLQMCHGGAALSETVAPSLRVAGAISVLEVLKSVIEFLDGVVAPENEDNPIIWVPSEHPGWGANANLVEVARQLKAALAPKSGLVLLPRCEPNAQAVRAIERAYGASKDGRFAALFDTCVTLPVSACPLSLELMLQPDRWGHGTGARAGTADQLPNSHWLCDQKCNNRPRYHGIGCGDGLGFLKPTCCGRIILPSQARCWRNSSVV